ncbi:hypothetical protein [Desulfonatronovibrio magnus]|uniref:hypothetical protein n=1 Tax=Desulfonatronovibrio magnus TaxID=698827 RepID=UPI0005EADF6E|nr:hypothetical protein [Desulfonatronovibrio magnus]
MVNLGLVKDFKSCPPEIPRLSFCLPPDSSDNLPVLKSWVQQGTRLWDLTYPMLHGQSLNQWVQNLTSVLMNLKAYSWCVNTSDLIHVFHLPLDKALASWGELFWPLFNNDCLFYFVASNDADLIKPVLKKWEKTETIICFRNRYDLTIERPVEYPVRTGFKAGIMAMLKAPLNRIQVFRK